MRKAKGRKRQEIATRKLAKKVSMAKPGYQSKYALKKRYLERNGGWGWQYEEPKPWKSQK